MHNLVIVRGAGDLASGVITKLSRCGFLVLALEINKPTAIRRHVAFSEAIWEGHKTIEGLTAVYAPADEASIKAAFEDHTIVVTNDPHGKMIQTFQPNVLIDATIMKKNILTRMDMAPVVIGIGPGHQVGIHCHAAVESMRGHDLGRIYYEGAPLANTGAPGNIGGYTKERVCYAGASGTIEVFKDITEIVEAGDIIAQVDGVPIYANISGLIRGMIRHGSQVKKGLKVADIDPRKHQTDNCFKISDKARTIAGACLEAIFVLGGAKLC